MGSIWALPVAAAGSFSKDSITRTPHDLHIHPTAGGHLGCVHFEGIVSTAALNILCLYSGGHRHSFLTGAYPGGELWGQRVACAQLYEALFRNPLSISVFCLSSI